MKWIIILVLAFLSYKCFRYGNKDVKSYEPEKKANKNLENYDQIIKLRYLGALFMFVGILLFIDCIV